MNEKNSKNGESALPLDHKQVESLCQKNNLLESQLRHLTHEFNSLQISLNFLLNKLKNYIDMNKNTSSDLQLIHDEAKALQEQVEEEAKSESENIRRDEGLNEIKARPNDFSRSSMESYHLEGLKESGNPYELKDISFKDSFCFPKVDKNTQINTICRKPKSEENEENEEDDLDYPIDFKKGKSYMSLAKPCDSKIITRTAFDRCQIKFLKGLKESAVGFNLENSGNLLKRSNDPILTIGHKKVIKKIKDHSESVSSVDEQKNYLKKSYSLNENEEQKVVVAPTKFKFDNFMRNTSEYECLPINETVEEGSPNIVRQSKSQKSFATKLFEDFVIIGADPQELDATSEKNFKSNRIAPRILFDFDSATCENNIKEEKPFYEVLPNFCFPFGLGVKRIHAEKRHQIITKNYNYEDNCEVDKERYFIVTFRHQNTYNQNYGSKMLEDMNPHHILYCISILIDDYFCKEGEGKHYYLVPKVYSFITYYPFPNLFFKFFSEMTRGIKLKRLELYNEENNLLKAKDLIVEIVNSSFTSCLEKISHTTIEKCLSEPIIIDCFQSKYNDEMVIFKIPPENMLQFQSFLWCSPLVFSNIPFEDFRFLLYALMMEKHIAFVSTNLTLLTSTVLTFFHIMRPILWVDTMVISLNETMFDLIGSPSPILIGLNASKKTLFEYADLMNHSDCLFYLLDENEIIYPEEEIQNILKLFPVFQDIKHALKKIYKESFNKMASHRLQNVILWKFSHNWKHLILNPTKDQEEKAKTIFLIIQERVKTNLIDLLPKDPPMLNENELDVQKIRITVLTKVKNKRDEMFLNEFMQTQNVMYFIQKHYGF